MPIHGRALELPASARWPAAPAAAVPRRLPLRRLVCGAQFLFLTSLAGFTLHAPPVEQVAAWLAVLEAPAPRLSGISIYAVWVDTTPVTFTVNSGWEKVPVTATAETVLTDRTLWRRMHFDDFDKIRNPLREQALEHMLQRYAGVLAGPSRWAAMDAHDWDEVPQPVRAMAFVAMARYWSEAYPVAAGFSVDRRLMGDTMAALVMVESWFDHRGTFTNPAGDRDIGVGAASEYCRTTLERLYQAERLGFLLDEADYFNPWLATRAMAAWFDLMIVEAGGDLDLAVRAYHRGIAAARRGAAADYLKNLKTKRRRFIRNTESSPAWNYLYRRAFEDAAALPAARASR